ncbi:DNA ligase (ATP), partial [Ceratobasidium sp. 370]
RFEVATQGFGESVRDVEGALEKIVEERGEGLVLKTPESPYVLAGREAFWVKVKPEYVDSMSDSVDLLVVAGMWGSGRRGGKVSGLICAVRDDYSRAGVSETGMNVYATFCRIGTGLTIDDYDWINKKKWIRMDKKALPPHIKASASNKREDKGDVYLDPEDWFIISVKAASISVSEEFGTNLTMRFPRCKAIRRDLSVDDCLTWSELRELHGGKRRGDQEGQDGVKKRKLGIRKKTTLSLSHQAAKVDNVEIISNLFEDMRFLVIPDLSSSNMVSKAVIEKLIHENGGDFTQVLQGDNSLTVIYGGTKMVPLVKRIMKREDMDILKPQWLTDSIEKGKLVPLQSKYYFFATQEALNDPAYYLDDEEPSTVVSAIRSDASSSNSKLDQNLFFRHLCFYLDTPENAQNEDFLVSTPHEAKIKQRQVPTSMDRVRRDILVHGGSIATGLSDPRLTHLVLHELDKSRRIELNRRTAKPKRRHMVLTSFISACISENTLLDEDAFMP